MSRHTIFSKLKKRATSALLQMNDIFWESLVSLFLVYAILLSHYILHDHLRNSIILQFFVMLFHLLLIIRVIINSLKNIYDQIKEFLNIKNKVNDNEHVSHKDSKRKLNKSKRMVRKGTGIISYKVTNRKNPKPKELLNPKVKVVLKKRTHRQTYKSKFSSRQLDSLFKKNAPSAIY